MASFSDLLDQMQGQGMFSAISPFKLKDQALASIANAAAHVESAGIGANAAIGQEQVRGHTGWKMSNIKDIGESFRQKLVNDAQLTMEGMRQSGATGRTAMEQSGATSRVGMQQAGETDRTNLMESGLGKRLGKTQDFQDSQVAQLMRWKKWFMGAGGGGSAEDAARVTNKVDEKRKSAMPEQSGYASPYGGNLLYPGLEDTDY